MWASFGFAGDTTDLGETEADDEQDAANTAWDVASERIDAWAELIEDDSE